MYIIPIVQWGFRSDTGYGGRTVTFPIAFTKQCFNGHVTTKRGGDSANGNNYVDKDQFIIPYIISLCLFIAPFTKA